jgi:hypothetical protein
LNQNGAFLRTISMPIVDEIKQAPRSLAFDVTGQLVVGTQQGNVIVFERECTGAVVTTFRVSNRASSALDMAISSDGRIFCTESVSATVLVYGFIA